MVPKHNLERRGDCGRFRAVLFRMVPKPNKLGQVRLVSFRAVLFRMVPKLLSNRLVHT